MKPSLKKTWIFLLLTISLLGIFAATVLVDDPVIFSDDNFELAVREMLNHYDKPIYRSQLLNIIELDLSGKGIYHLEGIENFRNLEILNLSDNHISELSPLETLTNLKNLDLGYNRVVDLEDAGFHRLENLQLIELNLEHNIIEASDSEKIRLSDISLLSQQSSLVHLNLEDNHIYDLTPLADFSHLEELNLQENRLENLTGLENLTSLQSINLRQNRLIDISTIQNMSQLKYLNLHSNENIKDLSPLTGLVNLEALIMRHVPIGDQISVLANMTNLRRLNIRNCSVVDFSPLFKIMAAGALQDQPESNLIAYLDILDNEIPNDPNHLRGFRPYWDNIHIKYPWQLNDSILFPPHFSLIGGFYEAEFLLELTTNQHDVGIHYTLDGSIPTPESQKYFAPILIPADQFDPDGNLAGTVVRARLFKNNGHDASPTVTHTYFVGHGVHDMFTLPVVSLVTNPDYFFDYEIGIYQEGNYRQRGKKWERPISFTLYELDGERNFSTEALVRIHGSATRGVSQKSLRFYAENYYASEEFIYYELFPGYLSSGTNEPMDQFSTFLLRNSGNDYSTTFFKDAMIQSLISHTSQDIQAYRPANVFLNGEYWGIYNIRERLDEYYLAQHYSIYPDEVIIYDIDAREDFYGQPVEDNEFLQLLELIKHNDIKDDEFYNFILTKIDIDNFIDNQIIYIYAANGDWLANNVRFWRKNIDDYEPDSPIGHDGRWRWMVLDMDLAFRRADLNLLETAVSTHRGAVLMNALVNNPQFLDAFINRFADHLNTALSPSRVVDEINRLESNLQPDMDYHIARWKTMGNSKNQWHENVDFLREFAIDRPDFMREHIINEFNLRGSYQLTLKADQVGGYVRINSVDINENTPGVHDPSYWSGIYFFDLPISLTAIPKPGYVFSHWDGVDADLMLAETIRLTPGGDLQITAIFLQDSLD